MKKLFVSLKVQPISNGFTLIELVIVLTMIAIILTFAVSGYSNYSIRAKINKGLYYVTEVKSAAVSVCKEEPTNAFLSNQRIGYRFRASEYVQDIVLSGTCEAPTITMTTRATGAQPDPVLTFNGDFSDDADQIEWNCVSTGLDIHTPKSCRN